jgi:hypothetical protein
LKFLKHISRADAAAGSYGAQVKFLCPHCDRLSELLQFEVKETMLVVTCSSCKQSTTTRKNAPQSEAAPIPASETPVLSPETLRLDELREPPKDCCAKCISPRVSPIGACAVCGLDESLGPYQPETAPWFEAAVETLAREWPDEKAHVQFLELATAHEALPWAARLYRIRAAHAPSDPLCQTAQESIVKRASTVLTLPSAPNEIAQLSMDKRLQSAGLVLVVLSVCIGLYLVIRAMSQ